MVRDRRIGPHEGHEFELLDRGKKHVAYFCDWMPEKFYDYLDREEYEALDWDERVPTKSRSVLVHHMILYRTSHLRDALRLYEILHNFDPCNWEALERETGRILGYSESEIEFYIQTLKRMTRQRVFR